MIERYGADTARFYVMQASPPDGHRAVVGREPCEGAVRFLHRLWKLVHDHVAAGVVEPYREGELTKELRELRLKLHRTIEKVADDYGRRMQFNTRDRRGARAAEPLRRPPGRQPGRARRRAGSARERDPAALAHRAARRHGALEGAAARHATSSTSPWPAVDPAALVQDSIELVVQVNGKLRGHIEVPANASARADRGRRRCATRRW